MKVTIYTINDCKFSQAEKEYLKKNNISFEEKNLETNREYLTEMLSVSDNFAGTPVTKVEKDNGEILVLKGFTQEEFAKAFDLAPDVRSIADTEVVSPDVAKTEISESVSTPTSPIQQTPSLKSEPIIGEENSQVANKPDMVTGSLSEPAVFTQSPTIPNTSQPPTSSDISTPAGSMMSNALPQQDINAPKISETPVNPLESQEVGPISIDTTNDASPAGTVKPATTPKSDEALNSVLENLQSQVQSPTDTVQKL